MAAAGGVALVGVGVWQRVTVAPDVAAAGPVIGASPAAPARPPRDPDLPPNILLVTLCSVRADHLGAWGHTPSPTPHLDALAEEGVVFERAWTAATFTLPSHATLLTGLLPRHVGVVTPEDTLAATHPTLPEVLRAYGYHTLAYAPVASRASFRAGDGLERGFDTFLEGQSPAKDAAFYEMLGATEPFFALVHFKQAHKPYSLGAGSDPVDPRVEEWNRRSTDRAGQDPDDWFVEQLRADAALRGHLEGLYDAALTLTDSAVGELLAGLDRRGVLDDTVIVVVGDHGQALGEEGHVGHQGLLQPEVLHVPLLVRVPGAEPRRVPDDVGLVDVAPTLLELAGATLPAVRDGRSLAPLLRGDDLPPRGVLAQADMRGVPPAGGPAEVLVRGDRWLQFSEATGWALRRDVAGVWEAVTPDEPPEDLLAERARLSGGSGVATSRPATDAERATLSAEGYW